MSKKNGDFLSGFSGGNTQKPLTEQNNKPVKESNTSSESTKKASTQKVDVTANKKIADKIVEEAEKKEATAIQAQKTAQANKATRPAQSDSAIIKAPEHVVMTDTTFHKRKIMKYGILGVVAIAVIVAGFFIFQMANTIEMPNFVNQDSEATASGNRDLMTWQMQNNISLTREHEFSLDVAEGYIIRQNREAGSSIRRGSNVIFTVSLGPDMEEIISLPDFYDMNRGEIRTWERDNRMSSIRFTEENHGSIEANDVIRIEFPSTVDPANFRRNDSVTIVISTGPETIQIGNLVGDEREKVDEFIAENPLINVELEFEAHESITHGTVLRQSIINDDDELVALSPGTRLPVGETLVLTLSAGNLVTVPNFSGMRRVEALEMAMDETAELTVTVIERYHDTIAYGRFISQSVDAGEEVYGEGRAVTVVYSLGRPWIGRFDSERSIVRDLVEINDDGAFLYVNITQVNNCAPRGSVISQSHYDQFVALNTTINIEISRGNLTCPEPEMPPGMPDDGNGDGFDG